MNQSWSRNLLYGNKGDKPLMYVTAVMSPCHARDALASLITSYVTAVIRVLG